MTNVTNLESLRKKVVMISLNYGSFRSYFSQSDPG